MLFLGKCGAIIRNFAYICASKTNYILNMQKAIKQQAQAFAELWIYQLLIVKES